MTRLPSTLLDPPANFQKQTRLANELLKRKVAVLLVRPRPYRDECLMGYLVRLAESNSYRSPAEFAPLCGFSMKNRRIPPRKILTHKRSFRALSKQVCVPQEHLETMAFQDVPGGIEHQGQSFNPAVIRFNAPRVCPKCLEEHGYCKSEWLFAPLTVCPEHKILLVDSDPETGERLTWYRGKQNEFPSGQLLNDIPRKHATKEELEFAQAMVALFWGKAPVTLPNWIQRFTSTEIVWAIQFLNRYLNRLDRLPPCRFSTDENLSVHEQITNVQKILVGWPKSFYQILRGFEDRPMSRTGQDGIRKHFRDLYDTLYARRNDQKPIAREFRKHFERYLQGEWNSRHTISPLPQVVHLVPEQLTLSQTAKLLGCRTQRISAFLRNGLLSQQNTSRDGHRLFDHSEVTLLKERLSNCLTLTSAAHALGITCYTVRQLVHNELIAALIHPDRRTRDWLFESSTLEALIERLKLGASRSMAYQKKFLSNEQTNRPATKSWHFKGYSMVQVIIGMLTGDIRYLHAPTPATPLRLAQFNPIDLADEEETVEYIRPKQFGEIMRVNVNSVYAWMKSGLIDSNSVQLKSHTRRVKVIPAQAASKFQSRFVTPREYAELLNCSVSKAIWTLKDEKPENVLNGSIIGVALYSREKLAPYTGQSTNRLSP